MAALSSSLEQTLRRIDKQMLAILLLHIPIVSFIVPIGMDTFGFALVSSLIVGGIAVLGYVLFSGRELCSMVFAVCLMLFSVIMIQARLGMIEMHFHIFSALAVLIVYRNWKTILVAAGFIAVHHLLFNWLQSTGTMIGDMPLMVFNHGSSWPIVFVHAGFVVFESAILVFFAIRMAATRDQAMEIVDVIHLFADQKDLTGRLSDGKGDATASAFNGLLDRFSALVSAVSDLSEKLKKSSATLTTVSRETTRVVEAQNSETEHVAAAMNEMASTVQEVANSAKAASEASSRAASASEDGDQSIDSARALTEATDSALSDTSKMVSELAEKVQSIDSFIASINGISEQTNLLALNAAIEAARAGEHGRGFAVVADEVRNLSRRTQEFTDEIRATIAGLSEGSDATLAAIEMSQTRARETTNSIHSTGEAIKRIREEIAEVDLMNTQIASSAQQQASAADEVNQSVQRVSETTEDVVSQAAQAKEIAEGLEQLVVEMNDLVQVYKTD